MLADYGNMSAPTVLFVLQRAMTTGLPTRATERDGTWVPVELRDPPECDVTLPSTVLAAVTAERLAELSFARRNTLALLRRGAIEASPGHYGLIVALHTCWLCALWVEVRSASVSIPLLWAFFALQAMRIWVLATLGRRWTTRIIVLLDVA